VSSSHRPVKPRSDKQAYTRYLDIWWKWSTELNEAGVLVLSLFSIK